MHTPPVSTISPDLLARLRKRPHARVNGVTFKAIGPSSGLHPFRVCGQPAADGKSALLWAHDHKGWLTMQAHIHFD